MKQRGWAQEPEDIVIEKLAVPLKVEVGELLG